MENILPQISNENWSEVSPLLLKEIISLLIEFAN